MKSHEHFKIGDLVKVIKLIDEEGNPKYLNKQGIIKKFNINGATENSKDFPLLVIKFSDGKMEAFWENEVELVNKNQQSPNNITITELKQIVKLSRKSIKELRKLNPERAYNGRDLTKYQLIYQIIFKADSPKK